MTGYFPWPRSREGSGAGEAFLFSLIPLFFLLMFFFPLFFLSVDLMRRQTQRDLAMRRADWRVRGRRARVATFEGD